MGRIQQLLYTTLLFNSLLFAQGEWIWQNPQPQGNYLTAIQVLDNGTIIAAGENGTILTSFNNGVDWNVQYYQINPQGRMLEDLHFVDSQTGWALVDDSNHIYYTTDGGYTWLPRGPAIISTFIDLFALDSLTAWVVGSRVVQRTIDGGLTWTYHQIGNFPGNENMTEIFFLDHNIGWTVGNRGRIYHTTDGGQSWSEQVSGAGNLGLVSLFFLDANNGWAGGQNALILATQDGGQTWNWQNHFPDPTNFSVRDISFYDANNGIAVGNDGLILTTVNGGNTWEVRESGTDNMRINDLFVVDNMKSWACGSHGLLLSSEDGGQSWQEQGSHVTIDWLHEVQFLDDMVGWVSGPIDGLILKTTDGGNTWAVADSGEHRVLILQFLDQNNGFRMEWYGQTYRTRDGGDTWEYTDVLGRSTLYQDGLFADTSNGWILGSFGLDGIIMKTSDGGESWIQQYSATDDWLYGIDFIDENTGWVAGQNGRILKTTDSGNSWQNQNSSTTETLVKIDFHDQNTGWIVGAWGTMLKTTDGGANWNELTVPFSTTLSEVFFLDENTGWIAGNNGAVARTFDGGDSWQVFTMPTPNTLQAGFFLDSDRGWLVGSNGIIFKYDASAVLIDDPDIPDQVSPSFTLHQNYPNPFNPETTIGFRVSDFGFISLKVFDLLGREVATLVKENLSPGSYQVQWDGRDHAGRQIASGVYFYCLKMDNLIQTRKLMLMR